jgi:hypothetical protein
MTDVAEVENKPRLFVFGQISAPFPDCALADMFPEASAILLCGNFLSNEKFVPFFKTSILNGTMGVCFL